MKSEYTIISDNNKDMECLSFVFTEAFRKSDLIGNVLLTVDELTYLHTRASEILKKALKKTWIFLTPFEQDIIFFAIVILLRNWKDKSQENSNFSDSRFWEFVCNQFSVSYNDQYFSGSETYRLLRDVVIKSPKRNEKPYAREGKRYYTTCLMHALSPIDQFEKLFEQIISFYAETLQYQYNPADPIFVDFSNAMHDRLCGKGGSSVYIKALSSSSAIKTLFRHYTANMASFTENVVKTIDILASGDQYECATYLDRLVCNWYEKRSQYQKSSEHAVWKRRNAERIIYDFTRIQPTYSYDQNDNLCLTVPPIRIGKQTTGMYPSVSIYCGDEEAKSIPLIWSSDDFGIVISQKTHIRLENSVFHGIDIQPRMVINYGEEIIYNSEERLYRNALAFDDDGNELKKRPDSGYIVLYTGENANVDIDSNDYYKDDNGHWRIRIDDLTVINVNRRSVLPHIIQADKMLIEPSTSENKIAKYNEGNVCYKIFSIAPSLRISLPDNALAKQYQLLVDDDIISLNQFGIDDSDRILVDLPDDGAKSVRIVDISKRSIIDILQYIVINNLEIGFNRFFLNSEASYGELYVSSLSGSECLEFLKTPGQTQETIHYNSGEINVLLPLLQCEIDGKNIEIGETAVIWHESIAMSSLLNISIPFGYNAQCFIENKEIDASAYEIGNHIAMRSSGTPKETIRIKIGRHGETQENRVLFEIVYKPRFNKCFEPLCYTDKLLWKPSEGFIGSNSSIFNVGVFKNNRLIKQYDGLPLCECSLDFKYGDGRYEYTVNVIEESFFGSETITIFSGKLLIGNPDEQVIQTLRMFRGQPVSISRSFGVIATKMIGFPKTKIWLLHQLNAGFIDKRAAEFLKNHFA